MTNLLFSEIKKFQNWALSYSNVPQNERLGEWECDYPDWDKIYLAFNQFINNTDCNDWEENIKDQLLYIIARDNEAELLAETLSKYEEALITLAQQALIKAPTNAKWQLAVQLKNLVNKTLAIQLLETFSKDDNEYVSKRAFAELKALQAFK